MNIITSGSTQGITGTNNCKANSNPSSEKKHGNINRASRVSGPSAATRAIANMYLTGSFPNRSGNICSQHPLPSKSSREVTKEQTANLYHRNFTSAGFSASSVEKYHYPSDCHRRNRGNLFTYTGSSRCSAMQKSRRTR